MIVILHDSNDAASRAFVSAHGEGNKVVDRAAEPEKFDTFVLTAGIAVSAFPTVYDTERKLVSRAPATLAGALAEFDAVPKEILRSEIIARLKAIPSGTGTKFDDACAALSQDAKKMFLWNSMVSIRVNDADVSALLQGIGVTPSQVLY